MAALGRGVVGQEHNWRSSLAAVLSARLARVHVCVWPACTLLSTVDR